MRELTVAEMQQVSGGFNFGAVLWGYTVGFAVGAWSGAALGPVGMLAGGIVGGFNGTVVAVGEELMRDGIHSAVTGEKPTLVNENPLW